MIMFASVALVLAAVIFLITFKIKLWLRILIVGTFVITTFFLLSYLIKDFDKPDENSRIITKEEINAWSNNNPNNLRAGH